MWEVALIMLKSRHWPKVASECFCSPIGMQHLDGGGGDSTSGLHEWAKSEWGLVQVEEFQDGVEKTSNESLVAQGLRFLQKGYHTLNYVMSTSIMSHTL
jgi:hypothetical protein